MHRQPRVIVNVLYSIKRVSFTVLTRFIHARVFQLPLPRLPFRTFCICLIVKDESLLGISVSAVTSQESLKLEVQCVYGGKTGVTADRDKIEFRLFNSSSIFNITLREE